MLYLFPRKEKMLVQSANHYKKWLGLEKTYRESLFLKLFFNLMHKIPVPVQMIYHIIFYLHMNMFPILFLSQVKGLRAVNQGKCMSKGYKYNVI